MSTSAPHRQPVHQEPNALVPPEPDRYEERYRLTIGAALGLASIFALVLGIIAHLWAIFVPVALVLALLAPSPASPERVRRRVRRGPPDDRVPR